MVLNCNYYLYTKQEIEFLLPKREITNNKLLLVKKILEEKNPVKW